MKPWLKSLSIKSKLVLFMSLTSFFALLLTFMAFLYLQAYSMRNDLFHDVELLAQSVAWTCSSADILSNPISAQSKIDSLKAKPDVYEVRLTDAKGDILAQFSRGADENTAMETFFSLLPFRDYFDHIEPVIQGHDIRGYLTIRTGYSIIAKRLCGYAALGAAGLLVYSLFALVLANYLQRFISRPVELLLRSMDDVARSKDYSKRLVCDRSDEMGRLFAGFNNMLGEIEKRDGELKKNQNDLDRMAHHDALTGLANRLLLSARMEQSMSRSRRMKTNLAVLFVDLDRFKNINDSFGHDHGDRVLKLIASRLQSLVRDSDTVARIGGDEFIIIIEQVKKREDIVRFAQKLLTEISAPIDLDQNRFNITATIGISLFPEHGDSVNMLLKCADLAMYEAKDDGRNSYQLYAAEMEQDTGAQVILETRLRESLNDGNFVLHYQPQFDLQTGDLIGFEALLRWHDPEQGLVSPDQFISLAEESGLIIPIGEWIIAEACRTLKGIQDRWSRNLRMAVNISPRQFRDETLISNVAKALYRSQLDPDFLELEITESMVMNNVSDAIGKMNELKRIGVHLAIDDFGTGYSSLGYLKKFPLTRLKIDRSFVRDLPANISDQAIVNSIIALGKTMKLDIIAEGIETQEQYDFLKSAGCDQVQGYLLGHPLPLEKLPSLFDSIMSDQREFQT